MNICVIGTGYVGLCTGIGLSMVGHNVICVGRTQEKVDDLNKGKSPIYEKGMEEQLEKHLANNTFTATTNLRDALMKSEITFIAVGTPSREDGSIDLTDIRKVSEDIGDILKEKNEYHVFVVKSTVVPGTSEDVVIPAIETRSGKTSADFGVCMNPEFLREGRAIEDFVKPDRIVIGAQTEKAGNLLQDVYQGFTAPIQRTTLKTAEMIKYASNSFLATKISYINEIGNICKEMGIDTYDVAKGMGLDKRIGPLFLNAGIGFGGSCFPKDVSALIAKAKEMGYQPEILEQVMTLNKKQRQTIIHLLSRHLPDLQGKKIALLGLAFKEDTDDIREAPAIDIIQTLKGKGADVHAYDPKAVQNMKKRHPDITYSPSVKDALIDADACLILTEWEEFKYLTNDDFSLMKQKIILEGRKVLDKEKVTHFEGVCW